MSEFSVEVVRIGPVEKHTNADTLSITQVHNGYPVIMCTGDFKEGDLAVYVPVDSLVPLHRPEFKFLDDGKGKTHSRIRARKLRGVFSMGLLVPVPIAAMGAVPGDDVQAALEIEKYLPPSEQEPAIRDPKHAVSRAARRAETYIYDRAVRRGALLGAAVGTVVGALFGQPIWFLALVNIAVGVLVSELVIRRNRKANQKPQLPIYDIEGLRKHHNVFQDGEEVIITEKIHGCNSAFVHTGKKFHIKSRTVFRQPSTACKWHQAAKKYNLEAKLKDHPNLVLFGEIYGADCQDLDYGVFSGDIGFAAFDGMNLQTREYLNWDEFREFCDAVGIPRVPVLYRGPWCKELAEFAEGKSVYADHTREGIVIKPVVERVSHGLGRTLLKLAGNGYHLRKEAA